MQRIEENGRHYTTAVDLWGKDSMSFPLTRATAEDILQVLMQVAENANLEHKQSFVNEVLTAFITLQIATISNSPSFSLSEKMTLKDKLNILVANLKNRGLKDSFLAKTLKEKFDITIKQTFPKYWPKDN